MGVVELRTLPQYLWSFRKDRIEIVVYAMKRRVVMPLLLPRPATNPRNYRSELGTGTLKVDQIGYFIIPTLYGEAVLNFERNVLFLLAEW